MGGEGSDGGGEKGGGKGGGGIGGGGIGGGGHAVVPDGQLVVIAMPVGIPLGAPSPQQATVAGGPAMMAQANEWVTAKAHAVPLGTPAPMPAGSQVLEPAQHSISPQSVMPQVRSLPARIWANGVSGQELQISPHPLLVLPQQ